MAKKKDELTEVFEETPERCPKCDGKGFIEDGDRREPCLECR